MADQQGRSFGQKIGRFLMWLRFAVSLALFLAVFASLHPIGDSLSVIQLPLGIFALFLAVFRFAPWSRFFVLVMALLAVGQVGLSYRPGTAGDVVVYQKNLLHLNHRVAQIAEDILARAPDVVTLQEVTPAHLETLKQELGATYPSWQYCPGNTVRNTAIASRWPIYQNQGFCESDGNFAALHLNGPLGPVWAVSMHLHWPWPYEQSRQVPAIMSELIALQGPILIGGDFNMLPWSNAVTQIARASRNQRAGGVTSTFMFERTPLPIDHVMAPAGGTIERLPRIGSDHHGLLARVRLRP